MILNTGARTDTVQYFSDWLFRRFKEGYVCARNPLFPNKVIRYELSPEKIDAVLFCSKNYAPALSRLHEITDKYRTIFTIPLPPTAKTSSRACLPWTKA